MKEDTKPAEEQKYYRDSAGKKRLGTLAEALAGRSPDFIKKATVFARLALQEKRR